MSPPTPLVALPLALGAGAPTLGELAGVVALAIAATAAISRAVLVADGAVGNVQTRLHRGARTVDGIRLVVVLVAVVAALASIGLLAVDGLA